MGRATAAVAGLTTLIAVLACGGGAGDEAGEPDVETTCAAMFDDGPDGFDAYEGKQVLLTGKFRGSNSNFEMETGGESTTRCKLSMAAGEVKTGMEGELGAVQCRAESFNDPFGPDLVDCRHVEGVDVPEPVPDPQPDRGKAGKGKAGKGKAGKGKTKNGKGGKGGKGR